MAIGDDFSFPKLTTTSSNNSLSQFSVSSQSMWRISSLVYPHNPEDCDNDYNDDEDNEESRRELPRKHKSFSEFEIGDSEARMDLLWQDFNERELKRVSSLDCRIKSSNLSRSESTTVVVDCSGGDLQNLPDRVQARFAPGLNNFKVSARRSSLVRSRKRTTTAVFLRALRKLFFVHNHGREKKNV